MKSNRLEQLLTFLENSPGDAFISFAIAKEYEGMNELDKALASYEALVKSNPDYVGTYYHLGKLYENLEKFEAAETTFEAGILVAKAAGDKHSAGELQGALDML